MFEHSNKIFNSPNLNKYSFANNVRELTPLFEMVLEDEKSEKSVKYMYDNQGMNFQCPNSKTTQSKSLSKIVAGLNHLLNWAKAEDWSYNTEEEYQEKLKENKLKRDFINRLTLFLNNIYKDVTDSDFTNRCFLRLHSLGKNEYGESYDLERVYSDVLQGHIEDFMADDILMRGIIKYSYEFHYNNSESNKTMNAKAYNLNAHDLFALACITVIVKLVFIGFSVFAPNCKSDYIVYNPSMYIIENIQSKIIEFCENDLHLPPLVMSEILNNKTSDNIINYLMSNIDNILSLEKNSAIFSNIGITLNSRKLRAFKTTITALYKYVPIYDPVSRNGEHLGDKQTEKIKSQNYTVEKDWYNYHYVTNGIMKFITQTMSNIIKNNNKERTNATTKTVSDDTSDSSVTYKQEMFLEARNVTALKNKKATISLLKKWCLDHIDTLKEYEQSLDMHVIQIGNTPLRQYMLTVLMNEVAEDLTAMQLIDKNTISLLMLMVSYKLYNLGYRDLAQGVLAKEATDEGNYSIDNKLFQIHCLKKYQMNPFRTERYIRNIATRAYILITNTRNISVDISTDFIDFLTERENHHIKLIDDFIFKYAIK